MTKFREAERDKIIVTAMRYQNAKHRFSSFRPVKSTRST